MSIHWDFYPASDKFIEQDNGHCRLLDGLHGKYPLTFSIRATKLNSQQEDYR